jgi:hypothetical protein
VPNHYSGRKYGERMGTVPGGTVRGTQRKGLAIRVLLANWPCVRSEMRLTDSRQRLSSTADTYSSGLLVIAVMYDVTE